MIPQTKDELAERILEDLGAPVIKINIAQQQLNNAIDDAVDYWQRWHNEGQERTFLKITITQEMIDTNRIKLPDSVFGVLDIIDPYSTGSQAGWMSYEFEMTRDAMYDAMRPGSGVNSSGPAIMVATKQYLSDIRKLTAIPIPFDFRYHKHELYIFEEISKRWPIGSVMLIEVIGFLYKNSYNIWGDKELRQLATAYAKKIWGQNLKKFSGVSLPGGTLLNGDQIYNDALQDIQTIEQFIMTLQEPLGIVLF